MNVIENETSRRFPRTLQAAFPISEGYREAISRAPDLPPIFRTKRRMPLVDKLSWLVSIGAIAWLFWAVMNAPGPK